MWQLSYQCAFKKTSKLGNFCIAILILKVEENKQHFGILCFIISKGKNTTKMQKKKKKIRAVYEEGAMTDRTSQKWFAKFRAGDFLLDYAPWLDRPVEVDSYQIETLIEKSQRFITQEIADILKISKSIKLLVIMKNAFYFMERTTQTIWPTQCIEATCHTRLPL